MKSTRFSFQYLPMDFAKFVLMPLLLVFRIRKMTPEGEKYAQKLKGGAIIAANHTSMADPFIIATAFWYRRMFYFVAEAVMGTRLRATLLKGAGGIRVERGTADIEAIKRSVETLKQGKLLTIFPEGKIKKEDNLDSIKSGAVLIALKADVPIIPVHILPLKSPLARRCVIIGQPIRPRDYCTGKFPSTADIEKVTGILLEEMKRTGVTV